MVKSLFIFLLFFYIPLTLIPLTLHITNYFLLRRFWLYGCKYILFDEHDRAPRRYMLLGDQIALVERSVERQCLVDLCIGCISKHVILQEFCERGMCFQFSVGEEDASVREHIDVVRFVLLQQGLDLGRAYVLIQPVEHHGQRI